MKRGYTVEEYREMLARIRETMPDAAVTSDFIVGFCGETDEDFQTDGRAGARVRGSRTASSSSTVRGPAPRARELYRRRRARRGETAPQQRAAGDPERDQRRRQPAVHRPPACEVLVEGPSKTARQHDDGGRSLQLVGRTDCDRIVVFDGNRRQIGQLLAVDDLRRQRVHAVRQRRHQHTSGRKFTACRSATPQSARLALETRWTSINCAVTSTSPPKPKAGCARWGWPTSPRRTPTWCSMATRRRDARPAGRDLRPTGRAPAALERSRHGAEQPGAVRRGGAQSAGDRHAVRARPRGAAHPAANLRHQPASQRPAGDRPARASTCCG